MEELSSNINKITHSKALYAEVLLPVPIPRCFTYKVPDYVSDKIETGYRVIVEFRRTIMTGFIWDIHKEPPLAYYPKFLLDVIDERPVISHINEKDELTEFVAKHLFERSTYYDQAQYKILIDEKSMEDIIQELNHLLI